MAMWHVERIWDPFGPVSSAYQQNSGRVVKLTFHLPLLSVSRMSVSTHSTTPPPKTSIATRNYVPEFNLPHLRFSFRREDHFNFRSNWIQNSIKFGLSYMAVPDEAFRFSPPLNFNLIHEVCEYKIFLASYVNPSLGGQTVNHLSGRYEFWCIRNFVLNIRV
jgi:hypothetical protein